MIKTLKFGGTSVGSAENIKKVSSIVVEEPARLTVLSAMSGTTDALVILNASAIKKDSESTKKAISNLNEKYSTCINQLLTRYRDEALDKLRETAELVLREAENFIPEISDKKILAQGEILTSAIFTMHMQELGHKAVLLYAPDFMRTDPDGKVDIKLLRSSLEKLVSNTDPDIFYITQGFICTNHKGELDNLGRGGSDYSAALMGVSINSDEVQIWTDIDGMHNNDPRFVQNTFPIRRMSFDEAAELAYFGAKILHPSTIQPCKEAGADVRLKNTMDPSAEGTLITDSDDSLMDFHAIAAKDNITVIRITSARMLMAYGFLRKVFEVFENHKTPIDMITTSEVAVSLTIDNTSHMEEIVKELSEFGSIEVEHENTIICVVGRIEYDHSGLASCIFSGMGNTPIKMISYGASHRSLVMLISTDYKKAALQSLNDKLFTANN